MSVLRQFKLFSAPQASPWPYLVFFFFTSCCCNVLRQRQPASTSLALSRIARPQRAGDDDGFEFLRAENRAAAVGGEVIVIVGQHGGAIQVFPGGADAQHSGIAVADDFAQAIFGVARAQRPRQCAASRSSALPWLM